MLGGVENAESRERMEPTQVRIMSPLRFTLVSTLRFALMSPLNGVQGDLITELDALTEISATASAALLLLGMGVRAI